MDANRRKYAFLKGFLGLSALAHLNLLLLAAAVMSLYPDGCHPDSMDLRPFEVSLVPSDEASLMELDPELEKLKEELEEELEEEKKKEKDEKGQVVEIAPPREEKRPDKARFVSEYDSTVKKQTKGKPVPFKKGSLLANRPMPQIKPQPRPRPQPPPTPQAQKKVAQKAVKLAMRSKPEVPRSELPESETGDQPAQVEPTPPNLPRGPARAEQEAVSPALLEALRKMTPEEISRALGSRVNDYLPNVAEGESTLLNSKRWRFASFFNRVKRRVAENWHPGRVYKRRDPAGNIYGYKDRLTILRVRLTPKGRVKELHLETASGVGFLDDEALSAFRAAGPFPNPPGELVNDGTISFRFGFLFEISRSPTFRIFRQR